MKYKSLNFITNYLIDIINKEADNILLQISNDYDLEYDILKKKYLNDKQISEHISQNTTFENTTYENTIFENTLLDNSMNVCKNIECNVKNTIDAKIRCLGVIKSGAQCARTRKDGSEFCLIHQKSLKFGKIHNF